MALRSLIFVILAVAAGCARYAVEAPQPTQEIDAGHSIYETTLSPNFAAKVLSPGVKYLFDDYLKEDAPLVFAISEDGRYAYYWKHSSVNEANRHLRQTRNYHDYIESAIRNCEYQVLGSRCYVHAVARQVQNDVLSYLETFPVEVVRAQGATYLSPDQAHGVILYFPGYSGWNYNIPKVLTSLKNASVPHYANVLAQKGWDVSRVNLDRYSRGPARNSHELVQTIAQIIDEHRAQGYKKIVLAGQSRGGHEVLFAASKLPAATIDAVITTEPDSLGPGFLRDGSEVNGYRKRRRNYLKRRFRDLQVPRVVFSSFKHSDWYFSVSRVDARKLVNPVDSDVLRIVNPKGHSGHGAGSSVRFGHEFGGCIHQFLLQTINSIRECEVPEISSEDPRFWASSDNLPSNISDVSGEELVEMSKSGAICNFNIHAKEIVEPHSCLSFYEDRRLSKRYTAPFFDVSVTNDSPVEYLDNGYCKLDKASVQNVDKSCLRVYRYEDFLIFYDARDREVFFQKHVPGAKTTSSDFYCETDVSPPWDRSRKKILCLRN
ncbi:MAG: hypothetical protein AAF434_07920 [Pseudomonadota bacterium]